MVDVTKRGGKNSREEGGAQLQAVDLAYVGIRVRSRRSAAESAMYSIQKSVRIH